MDALDVLVSLTLRARTVFKDFEKMQAISLYRLAAQWKIYGFFDAKISADFNELSLFL